MNYKIILIRHERYIQPETRKLQQVCCRLVNLLSSSMITSLLQVVNKLEQVDNWDFLSTSLRHTSKPGPDSDLDSDPKKIRTREKPGLVLGLAFKKPGLDNRKPGLQIENTGFVETGF